MWPSRIFQPHLVSCRLPGFPFHSSIWRKTQRVWYMYFIAVAVGGKSFFRCWPFLITMEDNCAMSRAFGSHNQHKIAYGCNCVSTRPRHPLHDILVGRTIFSCFTRSQISSAKAGLLATLGRDDVSNKAQPILKL